MPNEQVPTWQREPGKPGSLAPLRGSRYPMIDAHLHAINFAQETPGPEALIAAMDRSNVARAVIFGLPVAKLWAEWDRETPDYYLANDARCYYYGYTDVLVADLVQSLPPEQQQRLYPLMCGFNPTDKLAVRDVKRLYERYPDVWCGIGELLLRHDDLSVTVVSADVESVSDERIGNIQLDLGGAGVEPAIAWIREQGGEVRLA